MMETRAIDTGRSRNLSRVGAGGADAPGGRAASRPEPGAVKRLRKRSYLSHLCGLIVAR